MLNRRQYHILDERSAFFQLIVQFLTLIATFCGCPCVIFQLPFFAVAEWIIKKPRVVSHNKVYCPAVFCIRTGIFTGAGSFFACEANLGVFEFCSALYGFGAVPVHSVSFTAYGDTVIADGDIILVDGWSAAFAEAVFVIRHGVMGGI